MLTPFSTMAGIGHEANSFLSAFLSTQEVFMIAPSKPNTIRATGARMLGSTLALLILAGCSGDAALDRLVGPEASPLGQGLGHPDGGPGFTGPDRSENPVAGQVLVTFRRGTGVPAGLARNLADATGGTILFVYENALEGVALAIPESRRASALAILGNHPLVTRVEDNAVVELSGTTSWNPQVQLSAPWGLDRVDQRARPLDGQYGWGADGAGIRAYVVDSGLRFDHEDFGGRAVFGADLMQDGRNGLDCTGHGTHVAGTLGGSTYGVAKGVELVAVRAFGCTNSSDYAILTAAMDWIASLGSSALPGVVNLSFSGPTNLTFNAAVDAVIDQGLVVVAAAGNMNADACTASPAGVPRVLTVGATSNTDARASYSNHGDCLDLFAPGHGIVSTSHVTTTSTATRSGTSMASPHVAGVAAALLGQNPSATRAQIESLILSEATQGIVTNARSASNHLLYSLIQFPQ
jgi:aqualysin 1